MSYPKQLVKLIQMFRRFPGVGAKSAERFAFQMLEWSPEQLREMAQTVLALPEKIHTCTRCGALTEEKACLFCAAGPQKILCIVGTPRDIYSIDQTGEYRGGYHVLGALLSPMDGIGPERLQLQKLKKRIQEDKVEEVVIGLDSTLEGDATSLYLKQELAPLGVKVSRLAFGIPMGSSLEYVDGGTLARAFSGRSSF